MPWRFPLLPYQKLQKKSKSREFPTARARRNTQENSRKMVGIHVKHGGESDETQKEFLYECQSTSKIEEIAMDVTEIANLQSQIQCVGLQLQPHLSSLLYSHPNVSPFLRALSEAISYASKDQVLHNRPLSKYVLKNHIQNIEREFISNYDIMGHLSSNLQELLTDLELYQEDTVQLWWAKKEILRGKRLCDYVGKNEKTKIILRLQSPSLHSLCNSC